MPDNQLATRPNGAVAMPYPSLDELREMGEMVVKSGLAPEGVKTAEMAAVLMLKGRELGLRPLESLDSQYVVNGAVHGWTKLLVAQFQKAGHSYVLKESTAERCIVEFWLKGETEPHLYTLTMAEAKQAGWGDKPLWKKMPRIMLRWRCLSTGIKAYAPEVERVPLDTPEIIGMASNPDADVWNDPDAIGQRIIALQDRLDEILDQRDGMQDDEVIEAEVTDVKSEPEPEPHWTDTQEGRDKFMASVHQMGLNDKEVFAALSTANETPIARVGQFAGTLPEAIDALCAYVEDQAAPKAEPVAEQQRLP